MSRTLIEFEFLDIEAPSDRTVRSVLKDIGKAVRRAQRTELDHVLNLIYIEPRDRQSLNDRIRDRVQSGPVYYVELVESGSLFGKLSVAAFSIWLLDSTLGETIKEAWKETEIHEAIIKYVEEERPTKFVADLIHELRSMDLLSGRAEIAEIEPRSNGDGSTTIKMVIARDPNYRFEPTKRFDENSLIEYAQERIEHLREND